MAPVVSELNSANVICDEKELRLKFSSKMKVKFTDNSCLCKYRYMKENKDVKNSFKTLPLSFSLFFI